jgi:Fic family protein
MAWNLKDLESQLLIGSTLVEGSTLSEAQARAVLTGRTIQGHPIHEVRELLNYRASVEWLMGALIRSQYISVDLIQQFHQRLFQGFPGSHGQWKSHPNFTYRTDGSRFDYAHPGMVPQLISDWVGRFNAQSESIEDSATLYFEFQRVHPFEDGNGRIGRILIAYWFHWKVGRDFTFRLRDKGEHLVALEAAGRGDFGPLRKFFLKRVRRSGSSRSRRVME